MKESYMTILSRYTAAGRGGAGRIVVPVVLALLVVPVPAGLLSRHDIGELMKTFQVVPVPDLP
jgi:fumarate reductase subunit D